MKENTTVYDLTPALVASRIHAGRQRGDLPAEARLIVAATDLNGYGLHSAISGFSNDQTGWLAWYGRHDNEGRGIVPKDCQEQEAKRRMFEALVIHGQNLAALPLTRGRQAARIGLWLIDAGYFPDIVKRYVEGPGRTLGIQAISARGYSAQAYKPYPKNVIGQAREQCHLAESAISGRFIAFCACYWREIAQRAFLGTPNAPGSMSLYDGAKHGEFSDHICREKLLEKLHGQYGTVWRWATAPGWHDWLDALVMLYIGATWGGIGTMGATPQARAPMRNMRRVRHIEV